jgi:mRNA interferase RelE/StbE
MRYRLEWERQAAKGLTRLDRRDAARVGDAVAKLSDDPRPHGAEAMKGKEFAGHFRIRVGLHLRVVYRVDDEAQAVTIVRAGQREGIY